MMEGWELLKLGDVCAYDKTKHNGESLPYVGLENIQSNTGIFLGSTEPTTVKSSTFSFTDEHLLYGRLRPYLNKVLLPDFSGHCSTEIFPIKPNGKIARKFLYYWLIQEETVNKINATWTGARMPRANMNQVINFKIPIPPLQEQQQIVSILDEAFEAIDQAIANIEKNIANAQELFQSKLNEIFSQRGEGWEEKTLGEIGKISMCKRIYKKQTSSNGDIPFYKIGTFGKKANAFISREIFNEYKEKYSFPKKGDILISASGTIGRRVRYDGEPAYFQDSNIVWIVNDEELVTNDYLYKFYGVCDWNPSKGATISRLYNDDLKRITISFPRIEEQPIIVSKIKKLKKEIKTIENLYNRKIINLEELKKSILQKAFAGELTNKEVEFLN